MPDVLERFSDQACRVVVRSREEARALNHNWIGTEHLMLALIAEGSGMAAQVLESLEISLEAARWLVEVTLGRVEQAPSDALQKDRGRDAPGMGSRLDEQAHARLLDNPLARIDALDRRLALVERSLSLDSDLGELDQQTVTARRETAATVDMQEFEVATGLRRSETQRPAARSPRQQRLERAAAGQLPLVRELGRLHAELDKLRAILREHGIDPGDDPA